MARKSQPPIPPPTRSYELWDRKADRVAPTNWSYEPISESELCRVRVGDAVRLLLEEPGDQAWEKIYFEVTRVDTYSGSAKPRKFVGKALGTYRNLPGQKEGTVWPFVATGDEISFQRRNIMEVPGWRSDDGAGQQVPPQESAELVEAANNTREDSSE